MHLNQKLKKKKNINCVICFYNTFKPGSVEYFRIDSLSCWIKFVISLICLSILGKKCVLLVLLLGSRGPSTVTLMAFWYKVICGGHVYTAMVMVKLLPKKRKKPVI